MQILLQDLRYGARRLAKQPGFSLIAVITLALGIGANTGVFSVVNALLLRPLPFQSPEQLVRITSELTGRQAADAGIGALELFDLQARSDLFTEVSGLYPINVNLTQGDKPERIEMQLVSVNYFALLGVQAAVGRVFEPRDYQPGNSEATVISDGLWRRRFGQDPQIIGKKVRLDSDLCVIVGVMPPGFRHPGHNLQGEVDAWAPSGYRATPFNEPKRGNFEIRSALARLRLGLTVTAAQAQLDVLTSAWKKEWPEAYPEKLGWRLRVIPLQDDLVGNVRPLLLLLLGAVALVLLIACANVANLLLAYAAARQREWTIRAALGASRGRIVRQLLTESALLSLMGGALGLFFTWWSTDALVSLLPASLPQLNQVRVDHWVLIFTLLMSVATGVIFGLAPAWQSAATQLEGLKEAVRGSTVSVRGRRLRSLLVVAEFALALVLLVGAVLLMRSFWRLQHVDAGFDPAQVMTARIWMPQPDDPTTGPYYRHAQRLPLFREVSRQIAEMPGVMSVGWINQLPLGGQAWSSTFELEGRAPENAQAAAEYLIADAGYFSTLRTPLLQGRYFTPQDHENSPGVALISESFARRFFPNGNALGQRLRVNARAPWLTIVGLVRDVRSRRLETEAAPQVYVSLLQSSSRAMTLVVRGNFSPGAMSVSIERAVLAFDPDLPVFAVRTMEQVMAASLTQRRFALLLFSLFAALALLLATIGLYGVMAYLTEQRTPEIGIRMALGAQARDVQRLILGHAMKLVLGGVALGLVAAVGLTRLLKSLLFGVAATDPLTFAGVALMLMIVALLACYLPARRAMKVDPMVALRYE